MEPTCLQCKHYKISDPLSGFCRILVRETGNKDAQRPMVTADHSCEKWEDCGQQYYIRLGWIKNKKKEAHSSHLK